MPDFPKSLISIGGEPLLGHLLRQVERWGPIELPPVFTVAGDDTRVSTFVHARCSEALIVRPAEPTGVPDAILLAEPYLRAPTLVLLGDLILDGVLVRPWPSPPAVFVWPHASPGATRDNFGVSADNGAVTALAEKPAAANGMACGIGAYLLTPALIRTFKSVPFNRTTRERGITDALLMLLDDGVRISVGEFHGQYFNINTPGDLAAANTGLFGPIRT